METQIAQKEKRKAWRQEGIAAWKDYQRTGLYLLNSEVIDWMNNIIRGKKVSMPKCHI